LINIHVANTTLLAVLIVPHPIT